MKIKVLLLFLVMGNSFAIIDKIETPEVFQREYIYTHVSENENIQTYGVNTCVAVAFFDSVRNYGSLIHFDASSDVKKGLSEVLENFIDMETLEVSLYGGQEPFLLEKDIIAKFKEFGVYPKSIVRNDRPEDSLNINLNLKTGLISKYNEIFSNSSYLERQFKMDRMKFSKKLYRHEDSIDGGDYIPYFENDGAFDFNFLN